MGYSCAALLPNHSLSSIASFISTEENALKLGINRIFLAKLLKICISNVLKKDSYKECRSQELFWLFLALKTRSLLLIYRLEHVNKCRLQVACDSNKKVQILFRNHSICKARQQIVLTVTYLEEYLEISKSLQFHHFWTRKPHEYSQTLNYNSRSSHQSRKRCFLSNSDGHTTYRESHEPLLWRFETAAITRKKDSIRYTKVIGLSLQFNLYEANM